MNTLDDELINCTLAWIRRYRTDSLHKPICLEIYYDSASERTVMSVRDAKNRNIVLLEISFHGDWTCHDEPLANAAGPR